MQEGRGLKYFPRILLEDFSRQNLISTIRPLPCKDVIQSDGETLSKNAEDQGASLFSRLDQLEQFRGEGGKFHFKLSYPELGGSNEWLQTSNPAEAETIEGFEPISLDYKLDGHSKPWGGLGLCKLRKNEAFICDTPTEGRWWMCIGCKSFHRRDNTIPGPEPDVVTRVEIYVMKNQFSLHVNVYCNIFTNKRLIGNMIVFSHLQFMFRNKKKIRQFDSIIFSTTCQKVTLGLKRSSCISVLQLETNMGPAAEDIWTTRPENVISN